MKNYNFLVSLAGVVVVVVCLHGLLLLASK